MEVKEEDMGAAEALLRFMYTGELAEGVTGSAGQLMRVLRVAHFFEVGCTSWLVREIKPRLGWLEGT